MIPPRIARPTIALAACTAILAAHACAKAPCATPTACRNGTVCSVGQCHDAKRIPVPERSQRVVLPATDIAVVSSSHATLGPTNVAFGKQAMGTVVLLLRFPIPFSDTTHVRAAYIVMDPAPATIPGPAPVRVSVARVLQPWSPTDVSWARLPDFSPPSKTVWASSFGHRPLRIDVTEQVRRLREHRHDDHGLAVIASPQSSTGETYAVGTGNSPHLDVYLR